MLYPNSIWNKMKREKCLAKLIQRERRSWHGWCLKETGAMAVSSVEIQKLQICFILGQIVVYGDCEQVFENIKFKFDF